MYRPVRLLAFAATLAIVVAAIPSGGPIAVSTTLATAISSELYTDIDPQSIPLVIVPPAGHDWHEIARSPADALAIVSSSRSHVTFESSAWWVSFSDEAGDLTVGTHQLGPFDGNGNCIGYCADLGTTTSTQCAGTKSGSFTVNAIEFNGDGDVTSADIDFRIVCRVADVMAGSVRYGVAHAVSALDQSSDKFDFNTHNVGESAQEQIVTFTNIGDVAVVLGTANVVDWPVSSAPGDYAITSDTCSGASIDVSSTCAVGITFTAHGLGGRQALLQIPDPTARGEREVILNGAGQQPTSLTLEATGSTTAPGPITFTMTLTPPTGGYDPTFMLENGPPSHEISWTVADQTNPPQRVYTTTLNLKPGTYTATASFRAQGGYLASSAGPVVVDMTGDSTPPVGQIVVENMHSGFTNDPKLKIHLPATDNDTGVAQFGINEVIGGISTGWIYQPYSGDGPTLDWFQAGEVATLYATWQDVAGNWSDPISQDVTVDTAPPNVAPPTELFVQGSTITGGKVAVDVPVDATDIVSGVADLYLNQKTNSGAWKDVPIALSASLTQEVANRLLAPGNKFTFRARATDTATNASAWAVGSPVNIKKVQESSTRLHYSSGWTSTSNAGYWDGHAKKTTKQGATVSITFTGTSIAWVSRVGPDRGTVQISIDGSLVDLYSASVGYQRVVWSHSWATRSTHTVTIKVLSSGRPVELDAFLTGE